MIRSLGIYGNAQVVAPNNSVDIFDPAAALVAGQSPPTRGCAIYVGGTGSVKVTTSSGNTVTFNNAQAGSILPVNVVRVHSTGTSATNMIALW